MIKRFKAKPKPCLSQLSKGIVSKCEENSKTKQESDTSGAKHAESVGESVERPAKECVIKGKDNYTTDVSTTIVSNLQLPRILENGEAKEESQRKINSKEKCMALSQTNSDSSKNLVHVVCSPKKICTSPKQYCISSNPQTKPQDFIVSKKSDDIEHELDIDGAIVTISKPRPVQTSVISKGINDLSGKFNEESSTMLLVDCEESLDKRTMVLSNLDDNLNCKELSISCESNSQNSIQELYEDSGDEHMENERSIEISISDPRPHKPTEVVSHQTENSNLSNIIKIHLNYLSKDRSEENNEKHCQKDLIDDFNFNKNDRPLIIFKNKSVNQAANLVQCEKNLVDLIDKNVINQTCIDSKNKSSKPEASLSSTVNNLSTKTKGSSKLNTSLLKKYKKQVPSIMFNKPMQKRSQDPTTEEKVHNVSKDELNSFKDKRDENIKTDVIENNDNKFPVSKPKVGGVLHKQLSSKPIPKVVEGKKKSSSDVIKDSLKTSPQISRPKHITSSYGKICYEMKQKYLNKYARDMPTQDTLTMLDLIFFNPKNNPMTKEQDEKVICSTQIDKIQNCSNNQDQLNEEMIDDVSVVTQLTVDKDGNIIIDPSTQNTNNDGDETEIFSEGPKMNKRIKSSHSWSNEETLKFYKALHAIGADFSSMVKIFPDRSRKDLKAKFKREERKNGSLIDKVLTNPGSFNIDALQKELKEVKLDSPQLSLPNDTNKKTIKNKEDNLDKVRTGKKRKSRKIVRLDSYSSEVENNAPIFNSKTSKMSNKVIENDLNLSESGESVSLYGNSNDNKNKKKLSKRFIETNLNKFSKKQKLTLGKNHHNSPALIRNLQAILAEDESQTFDSMDTASPVKGNQIMINTNIHYDTINITKSVSYATENFGAPIDVNITIEHKSVETKEDMECKGEVSSNLKDENENANIDYPESISDSPKLDDN